MSYTTNAAIRNANRKPKLIGATDHKVARCLKCEGACEVKDTVFVPDVGPDDNGDSALFRNRVEVLYRCFDCANMHWVIAMPKDSNGVLEFFAEELK